MPNGPPAGPMQPFIGGGTLPSWALRDPEEIERMLARYDPVKMDPIEVQAQRPAGMVDYGGGVTMTPESQESRDAAIAAREEALTSQTMGELRTGEIQPHRYVPKTGSQQVRDVAQGFRTMDYPDAESLALGMAVESLPGFEILAGARDIWKGLKEADLPYIASGVAGVLPGVPGASQVIKATRGAAQAATRTIDTARMARNMPTNITRSTADALVPMRGASKKKLLESAQAGDHLTIRGRGEDANIIGAPRGVNSDVTLNRMRDEFDRNVDLGQEGARWYRSARAGVKEIAAGDPAVAAQVAEELALTSMQATPQTNLGLSLRGRAAIEQGVPVPNIKTPLQAEKLTTARETGEAVELGFKTEPYRGKLSPFEPRRSHQAVHDIWDARAWGYTDPAGAPWDAGLSPSQHAFLDGESILAAERANARRAGGRATWTGEEVQASAWVSAKAEDMMKKSKKPMTMDEAIEVTKRSYPEFFERHLGYATHEAQPAIEAAGHQRRLFDPEVGPPDPATAALREDYAMDPRTSWTGPAGADVLLQEAGFLTQPTIPMRGIYGQELNQGQAARVLLAKESGGKYGRQLSSNERAALNMTESLRAYVDVQSMGAWHFPITGTGVREGQANLLRVTMPGAAGKMPTLGQTRALNDLASERGFYLSHTGDGFTLIPGSVKQADGTVVTSPRGKKLTTALNSTKKRGIGLEEEIQMIMGNDASVVKGVTGGDIDDAAIFFEDLWANEGSGQATRALLDRLDSLKELAPRTYDRLAESGPVREAILAKHARDVELGGARSDIQTSRRILGQSGIPGLREALEMGVPLPAGLAAAGAGGYLARQGLKREQGGT